MVIYQDDNKVTGADAGPWVDSARGVHMPSAILERAEAYGYSLPKDVSEYLMLEMKKNPDTGDTERDDILDEYEFIHEVVEEAEQWMNEHVAPPGYFFGTHPDWGDWGLYSSLLGVEYMNDLEGRVVAFADLEEWMEDLTKPAGHVIFVYKGREYGLLTADAANNIPKIVTIGKVEWSDEKGIPIDAEIELLDVSVGRSVVKQFPKKVTSGTSPVTIVAATKWSRGGNGQYPFRFVVVEWPSIHGRANKFSRYMQVDNGKRGNYFIFGHYFFRFEDAMDDLTRSMKENNTDFGVNSVAYIPGMDFNDKTGSVGRRVSKSSGMGNSFDIYLRGNLVDMVFFDDTDPAVVRKLLLAEGYDPQILVAKGR